MRRIEAKLEHGFTGAAMAAAYPWLFAGAALRRVDQDNVTFGSNRITGRDLAVAGMPETTRNTQLM